MNPDQPWKICVDTGGTFTDCVATAPNGQRHHVKVLSHGALRGRVVRQLSDRRFVVQTRWDVADGFIDGFRFRWLSEPEHEGRVTGYRNDPEVISIDAPMARKPVEAGAPFEVLPGIDAPLLASRMVTGATGTLPTIHMALATTRGTNALLERTGAAVALLITRGFRDLLSIGTQQRPDLFALDIVRPAPLYARAIEVDERIAADGSVLRPLDIDALAEPLAELRREGFRDAAVALMHSYVNDSHELAVRGVLDRLGFTHVSLSSRLSPFIRLLPRAETAVANAYLSSTLADYLARISAALEGGTLRAMTSAGGLVRAEDFQAKDGLLSGPAGGVVGAASAGRRSGYEHTIAFDMGGTSTDVARFGGDFEYVFEHDVADAHISAPALAIETVAAGGGSICTFDGHRLRVGPESAGAYPGPACYGAGGPLTLTDINVAVGRLDPDRFEIPVSGAPVRRRLDELLTDIERQTGSRPTTDAITSGFLQIANERMADAIRRVSVRKGYNPADHVLVAFGGAGPQHACAVAGLLGVRTVIIPRDASLLSALGLGEATVERFAERQIMAPLTSYARRVPGVIAELENDARAQLAREDLRPEDIVTRRRIVNMRFAGQDTTLDVEWAESRTLDDAFAARYRDIYGHVPESRPVEIESIRVVCSSLPASHAGAADDALRRRALPEGRRGVMFAGRLYETPVFDRMTLAPGAAIDGPAVVIEKHSSTIIDPGWSARVDPHGALVLESEEASADA